MGWHEGGRFHGIFTLEAGLFGYYGGMSSDLTRNSDFISVWDEDLPRTSARAKQEQALFKDVLDNIAAPETAPLLPDKGHKPFLFQAEDADRLEVRHQLAANDQLLYAARTGNHSRLMHALDMPSYINARDGRGNTALHLAAERGDLEAIVTLLEAGADVDAPNWAGQTPLHVVRGVLPAKALLMAGADPYLLDKSDQTIVDTRYPFVPEQNRVIERTPVLTAYLTRVFNQEEPQPTVEAFNNEARAKGIAYHPHKRAAALEVLAAASYPFDRPHRSVRASVHQGRAAPDISLNNAPERP